MGLDIRAGPVGDAIELVHPFDPVFQLTHLFLANQVGLQDQLLQAFHHHQHLQSFLAFRVDLDLLAVQVILDNLQGPSRLWHLVHKLNIHRHVLPSFRGFLGDLVHHHGHHILSDQGLRGSLEDLASHLMNRQVGRAFQLIPSLLSFLVNHLILDVHLCLVVQELLYPEFLLDQVLLSGLIIQAVQAVQQCPGLLEFQNLPSLL